MIMSHVRDLMIDLFILVHQYVFYWMYSRQQQQQRKNDIIRVRKERLPFTGQRGGDCELTGLSTHVLCVCLCCVFILM